MTPLQQYVNILSHDERHSIINSFEQFEKTGSIGDAPIRVHTGAFLFNLGTGNSHITMWMQQMAFECYRYYYNAVYK